MSLSYTTGNPNNLTGGTTASMNDIQGPFTDIKTFLTDGSGAVGDTILASPTNAAWRTIRTSTGGFVAGAGGLTTTPTYYGTGGTTPYGLWVPPAAADVAIAGKTTRLRLRASYVVNSTSAAITATWGLYPVTGSSGGSGALTLTLGTVVAGSTAAAAIAGANGVATGSSFDFSAVTSGNVYCIGVVGSGTQAANSVFAFESFLEMRHT